MGENMATTITDRLSGITSDVAIKAPCVVATSSNIALNGLQTIDSVAVTQGQRVLVKGQTDATTNGIYVADTGNWTRTKDFDGQYDVMSGSMVFVISGAVRAGTLWTIATADPLVIGTTALAFTQVNLTTGGGGGGSNPFSDAMALIKNTIDATKLVILSAAGITTGTTRTQTLQDVDDTFVYRASPDTLTNKAFDTAGTGNSFKINGTAISAVTGTGAAVLANSPALVTPALGTPASGNLSNCTNIPLRLMTAGAVGSIVQAQATSGSGAWNTTTAGSNLTTVGKGGSGSFVTGSDTLSGTYTAMQAWSTTFSAIWQRSL
jgi:hypothetical protein